MQYPIILDFEASSLNNKSYPIEVAWNNSDGAIEDHLIIPHPEWTDWDSRAQEIHKISREQLHNNGSSGLDIAQRMNYCLSGKTIYSDAPAYERYWNSRLFKQYGLIPNFSFEHISTYILQIIPNSIELTGNEFNILQKTARNNAGPQHRARNDVQYYIELIKLINNI